MESYKFIVRGKVQGVYFRKTIYENATLVNINGYVKNLDDGSVEAGITPKNDLELKQFRKILNKGSMLSRVDRIKMFESDEQFSDGFEIR
jgi:acylphosphatase